MQRLIKTSSKSTFTVLLTLSLACATLAQADQPPQNLFKELDAQSINATIHARDLTASWRVITLREPDKKDTERYTLYYTKDDVLSIGGQNYVVAYQLQKSANLQQNVVQHYLVNQSEHSGQRGTPKLLKSSELILTLLNKNQHLYDIKNFNPVSDTITALSKALVDRIISQSNLKKIALATFFYVQDHHSKFPPMIPAKGAAEIAEVPLEKFTATTPVQGFLMRYVNNKQLFLQPTTHRPYLPNYTLSQISEMTINNPTVIILFYEDAPDADGMRNVAYMDGHVKAITEAEFQRERKAQDISESGYPPVAKR